MYHLILFLFKFFIIFNITGIQPADLIFQEWNKNCFLFIFIISNRKIIRGMKRGLYLQKLTLCLIIHDISRKKLHNFFYHTLKLKICNRPRNWPYVHTYSTPSRKHTEAVHLREEKIISIFLSYKSGRVIFLLKSYFLRKTMIKNKTFCCGTKIYRHFLYYMMRKTILQYEFFKTLQTANIFVEWL